MRLHELAEALELEELTPPTDGDAEVTHGYASDLLSDVRAHAPAVPVIVRTVDDVDLEENPAQQGQQRITKPTVEEGHRTGLDGAAAARHSTTNNQIIPALQFLQNQAVLNI